MTATLVIVMTIALLSLDERPWPFCQPSFLEAIVEICPPFCSQSTFFVQSLDRFGKKHCLSGADNNLFGLNVDRIPTIIGALVVRFAEREETVKVEIFKGASAALNQLVKYDDAALVVDLVDRFIPLVVSGIMRNMTLPCRDLSVKTAAYVGCQFFVHLLPITSWECADALTLQILGTACHRILYRFSSRWRPQPVRHNRHNFASWSHRYACCRGKGKLQFGGAVVGIGA